MLSQYEKNLRTLQSNYDSWKTTPPEYFDEIEAEYYAEHPDETRSCKDDFIIDAYLSRRENLYDI